MERLLQAGMRGLLMDDNGVDLPDDAWSSGRNVRFKDGYVENFSGSLDIHGSLSCVPYATWMFSGATNFQVYAGLAKLYAANEDNHYNITRGAGDYTGTADDKWTASPLSGFLLLSNNVDPPQSWSGASAAAATALSAWPSSTTCKVIRAFKNHGVALNVTKSGVNYRHLVKWSHPADPGSLPVSWDETDETVDAGEADISDTDDAIVDGLQLGEQFMIYKQNSIYAMSYIGPPYIFQFNNVTKKTGCLDTNCVADTPKGHVILTQGDVMLFDGTSINSIIDSRNRKWLFENMDGASYAKSFVVANPWKSEVWVCFPSTESAFCDTALVWNYVENTWTVRDLPQVSHGSSGTLAVTDSQAWDSDSDTWTNDSTKWGQYEFSATAQRLVLASPTNSKLTLMDVGTLDSGASFTCYVERSGMTMNASEIRKLVQFVRPKLDGITDQAVSVYVGAQDNVGEDVRWSGPYPFTLGRDLLVDCLVEGRFLGLRYQTNGGISWRLRGHDVEYVLGGKF